MTALLLNSITNRLSPREMTVLVAWDWVVRSEPDAPHGGPIVALAVVGLLCGGMVACSETIKDVREMKKALNIHEGAGE